MHLIQQFARLSGVTVRTLHHYDRLGLLSPEHRSESGYRLYTAEDLVRLERIMVLRYLGLPLRRIREMLRGSAGEEQDITQLLRTQAVILRERRDSLTRVLRAVEKAEQSLEQAHPHDWQLFQTIIQEVSMQNNTEWTRKYYSEAAQETIDQRKSEWSPELQEKVSTQWNEMFAKVEAALAAGIDPASPQGRQLAAEWGELVQGFTAGNRDVSKGLNAMYADQANWAATDQKYAIKPELMEFIRRAASPPANR